MKWLNQISATKISPPAPRRHVSLGGMAIVYIDATTRSSGGREKKFLFSLR